VLPYTIGNYLADEIRTGAISVDTKEFEDAENDVRQQLEDYFKTSGKNPVDYYHRKLGKIMWEKCGMAREEAGLKTAIEEIKQLRKEFYADVRVPGSMTGMNPELEKAMRVADFIDLGELMCLDALNRNESCGGHFRVEFQDADGEAQRVDDVYNFVAAWEWTGDASTPTLHKEPLVYENIKVSSRSYK
jgi:succinate dehydrogenase / fumarate reductase, flavoprotein subunit